MEKLDDLYKKMKNSGKFDKLPLLADIIKEQFQKKSEDIFSTYRTAMDIFKEYLDFDPDPPKVICKNLTGIFSRIFKAIRFYAGLSHFSRIYREFLNYEKYLTEPDTLAETYADLSYLFWLQNDLKKSLLNGLQSLDVLEKSGNKDILPGRYTNIGYIYEIQGDFANAEKYYEEGLSYGMRINSDNMISLAYCGRGRLHLKMSYFRTAINYFLEAQKYMPNEKSEDYIAVCTNLGMAYGKLKNYPESLKYLTRYINDETKSENPDIYFSLLLNATNIYTELGDVAKAEKSLQEILHFSEMHKDPELMVGALINLGKVEINRKNWQKAEEHYQESKHFIQLTGNKLQDIVSDIGLGIVNSGLANKKKAISYLETALKKAKALKIKTEVKNAYHQLATVYEKNGDYEKALECLKQYQQIDAEIKDEQFNLDLKSLKIQYQKKVQKKENLSLFTSHSYISRELANLVKTPLIGTSKSLQEVVNRAFIAADQDKAAVLITGESGTGKEIIARIIHYAGSRKQNPFITVNSVAFAASLIESAFFGSEKGSFTGSTERKTGYFEAVQQGTLFLDEIGDMPTDMQSKFLRVLEEQVIHRVGSTKDIVLDFRLISATNKNLYKLSEANAFRFDLLNRINTLEIYIPPLRERKDDIPLLVDFFVSLFTRQREDEKPIISKATLEILINYDYPGNVRELKNIIQRTILLANKPIIEPEDIIFSTKDTAPREDKKTDFSSLNLADWETTLIEKAMQRTDNVQAKAAKLLGISPYALNRKLKKMRSW